MGGQYVSGPGHAKILSKLLILGILSKYQVLITFIRPRKLNQIIAF